MRQSSTAGYIDSAVRGRARRRRVGGALTAAVASVTLVVGLAPAAHADVVTPGPAPQLIIERDINNSAGQPGTIFVAGAQQSMSVGLADADGNPIMSGSYDIIISAIQYNGPAGDEDRSYDLIDIRCDSAYGEEIESATGEDGEDGPHVVAFRVATNSFLAANFSCTVDRAGENFAFLAVANPVPASTGSGQGGDGSADPQVLTGVTSPFDVTVGSAAKFTFVTPPSPTAIEGQPFDIQPQVALTDRVGNIVTGDVVDGQGNPVGPVQVQLIAMGFAPGGSPVYPPVICNGDKTGDGFPTATVADGVATFVDCYIDGGVGTWTVTASSIIEQDGLRLDSANATVTVSAAPAVPALTAAFTQQPAGGINGAHGVAGEWLAARPVVAVTDEWGRPFVAPVALRLTGEHGDELADDAAASLTCAANPLSSTEGAAQFTRCAVGEAGTYTITASVTVDGSGDAIATAVSSPFTIDAATADASGPGEGDGGETGDDPAVPPTDPEPPAPIEPPANPPASLAFTVQPTGAAMPGLLGRSPQVTVLDADGAPVDAIPVTLALADSSGATIICSPMTATSSGGVAAFTGCVVDQPGSYILTAAAGELTATSTSFTVGSYPTQVGTAPVGQPIGQTFGGQQWATNPTAVANNVNTATGALTLAASDLVVAGLGLPLDVTRTYNSADTAGGAFGGGWSSIFDAGVTISGKTAVVRGEDGARLTFTQHGSGLLCLLGLCGWDAPPGANATLSCLLTLCAVTRDDGTIITSLGGRTLTITGPALQGLIFTYSGSKLAKVTVAHSPKRVPVAVTMDSARHVTKLATPTRTVTYRYSGNSLTAVTDAAGATTNYGYTGPRLTSVTDPTGARRLTASYDGSGRVSHIAATGGPDRYDDTYSYSAGAITRTAADGGMFVDRYSGNVLLSQTLAAGGSYGFDHDSRLNTTAVTGPLGDRTSYTFNNKGDLTSVTTPLGATTRYTVDGDHRVTAVTDPDGQVTSMTWSGQLLTSITPPSGRADRTTYTYNLLGERTKEAGPHGTVTYTYDGAGNQTGMVAKNPDGSAINGKGPVMTFDEAGHVLTAVDPRGNHGKTVDSDYRTTYTYDAADRLLTTTQPGDITTATGYNAAGDVISTTAATGVTTNYIWDEGALTTTASTDGATVFTKTFDAAGNLLAETDAGSRTTTYTRDTLGQITGQTDPSGLVTASFYDAAGNLIATRDSAGSTNTYGYDLAGDVTAQYLNGAVTVASYQPSGYLDTVTDADGASRRYTYDATGQVASVTTPAGTTSYHYDASGNATSVTDGAGHSTDYSYDVLGHQTSMTVAGETWAYRWDAAGNLIGATDPDGRETSYTLDARDLRTGISFSQPGEDTISITQTFDAAGRRTAMTDSVTGVHSYGYDDSGNLTSATTGSGAYAGSYTYAYGSDGSMTETYPDGAQVSYGYDDVHNLMGLRATGSGAPEVTVSYLRDSGRRITGVVYANGLVTTQGYDAAGRLTSQQVRCAAANVLTVRYGYSAAGNPLGSITESGGVTTTRGYGYDQSGRVTAQTTDAAGTWSAGDGCVGTGSAAGSDAPGAPTAIVEPTVHPGLDLTPATGGIGYDAVGNRISVDGVTLGYDDASELTAASDGSTATYDHSGNLMSSTDGNGATTSYRYDAANRLASVALPGGAVISYAYDGDGNRVARSADGATSIFQWDIAAAVPLLSGEYTAAGELIRRYFYGVGPVAMQTPGGTYYYHTDARGDVIALSDAGGAVVADYGYDAFGNVTAAGDDTTGNPLLFQGQLRDAATGLYDMRARNYDPASGRFTQPDPIPAQPGTAADSRYVFAGNNPLVFGDPTGQLPELVQSAADDPDGTALGLAKKWMYGSHSSQSGTDAQIAKRSFQIAKFVAKRGITLTVKSGVLSEAGGKIGGQMLTRVGAVVAFGLSAYYTVDDCQHGPVATCVADVVGTVVGLACDIATEGVAAVACSLAAMALSEVIEMYGPDIAAYAVDLASVIAAGAPAVLADIGSVFETAGAPISAAFTQAGHAAAHTFTALGSTIAAGSIGAVGTVATGFNAAGDEISSGYRAAVSVLTDAGYTAAQLASVFADAAQDGVELTIDALLDGVDDAADAAQLLADQLHLGLDEIVAALTDAGYAIGDIALAAVDVLHAGAAATVAALAAAGVAMQSVVNGMKDVTAAAVADTVAGLKSGYGATADQVASAMQGAGYAANQVAGGLQSAYGISVMGVAVALDGAGYALGQVAVGVSGVYGAGINGAAQVLASMGSTVDDIALAFSGGDLPAAAASAAQALSRAGFLAGQVAGGLKAAYDDLASGTAAATNAMAAALHAAGYPAAATAAALQSAYGVAAMAAADALHRAQYSAAQALAALQSVYRASARAASDAMAAAHYATAETKAALISVYHLTADAINSLGGAFVDFGNTVADGFTSVGNTIASWF